MKSRASILVGLLWCMALLSVVVIGILHTSRMDLLVVKNYNDRLQAHYLALAGVERGKALLYHDYITRRQTSTSHNGTLYDDAKDFRSVALGRGQFRVFHPPLDNQGGGMVYGISDEESRLNINVATQDQLTNLDGLTQDMAAAIVDWRNDGTQPSQGGAEADYYQGLQPPYVPRNGSFQTVRELLLVRGVTRELLLGGGSDQNDMFDSGTEEGDESSGFSEGGWSASLTAYSTEKNLNAAGQERVNVQTASERDIGAVQGLNAAIAHAIVSYRGQNQLQNIANLLDVTAPTNNVRGRQAANNNNSNNNNNNAQGQTVIDDELLEQIADDVTVSSDTDQSGLININTAGLPVLMCLPSVDANLAQSIVSYRQSTGFFANIAGLLRVSGMTHDIFKQLAPLITARSETFRISSEGRVKSSGARQRMQAVVHIGSHEAITVAYREDLQ